jgi:hypothetical protein
VCAIGVSAERGRRQIALMLHRGLQAATPARCSGKHFCSVRPVGQVLNADGLGHSPCTRTSTAAPVEIPLRVSM